MGASGRRAFLFTWGLTLALFSFILIWPFASMPRGACGVAGLACVPMGLAALLIAIVRAPAGRWLLTGFGALTLAAAFAFLVGGILLAAVDDIGIAFLGLLLFLVPLAAGYAAIGARILRGWPRA